jgi:hypothetical protein
MPRRSALGVVGANDQAVTATGELVWYSTKVRLSLTSSGFSPISNQRQRLWPGRQAIG